MSRPFEEALGPTEGEVWPPQLRGNPWFWTKLLSERTHTLSRVCLIWSGVMFCSCWLANLIISGEIFGMPKTYKLFRKQI